ncbi:RNA helicase required for poly(A+) mRNA export [Nowakowskiella sp. JEL0407]|nr:RNA helicase required for poly(A+) mRNA export [Nowakowskiella sp. JEL0407]
MAEDGWGVPNANIDPAKGWGESTFSSSSAVDNLTNSVASLSTTTAKDDSDSVAPKHSKLVANANDIEVKLSEAAGESALYSGVSTFEELGLHQDLLKGLYAMGFERPSRIQERALPLLLRNPPVNMIGQSQSGTGKTAAFTLSMLSRIDPNLNSPQALCLAPSRELVIQIMDVVTKMGKYTPITTAMAVKESGGNMNKHVVVGTPGTVTSLLKRRLLDVSKLRVFVLDEADNMLDQQGLGDQSIRVKNQIPRGCQIVLFSATFPPMLENFAEKFAPKANKIMLKQEELSVDGIKQFYMDCKDEDHKAEVLSQIYGLLTIGQSIIFVRKREIADNLERKLKAEGHEVAALHGGQLPQQRDAVMDSFRTGECKVLITTNVIARGIDILQVNCVINFDMPLDANYRPDAETYLHRIGRTGRFGRTGVSINFVHDQRSFEEMKAIEEHFGRPIVRVPTENPMEIEKILKKAVN